MKLFSGNSCVKIWLKNSTPCVRLATEDLCRDFALVNQSGVSPEIVTEEPTDAHLIIEPNTLSAQDAIRDESFSLCCEGDRLCISAPGYLGTMWGIYTVSEQLLGIDPCVRFNDLPPEQHDSLEVAPFSRTETPDGFGFRGVFLNDEDLLTGWKDGGGLRYLDYPFYSFTVDPQALEAVVETVLRLKLNLVIPASFLDLDNPPEKALADCVARRGLYLSQHHIEPLGVSAFTFENYCRKYHRDGAFSFADCPERMEEVWRFYAEKWAQYDNVVWQIGLRGKGDRPLWQDSNPTEEELQRYGQFISRAMHLQKEIVLQATGGKAEFFTSTLWMEGSRLMERGLLTLPEGAITVFSDNGPDQMFGEDYHTVPRAPGTARGIYYHLQYWNCGPHLAPQTGLEKLAYHLSLAKQNGDCAFCILNVSNVREFVFELGAYSQLMWNTARFSATEYRAEECKKYGALAETANTLIQRYYAALPALNDDFRTRHLSKYFNYSFRPMPDAPPEMKPFILKEGIVRTYGLSILHDFYRNMELEWQCAQIAEMLPETISLFRTLCEDFHSLADSLPAPQKRQIEVKWGLYAETLLAFYEWYLHLYAAKRHCDAYESDAMKESLLAACSALETLLRARKRAEYGAFAHWYRGDVKMNIREMLTQTRRLLGQVPEGF